MHPAGNHCGAGGPASYPPASPAATLRLTRRIHDRIARAGPLDFAAFMEAALYDAADGYYADPGRAIGRHGDFFTSVSVGPAFGAILARWLLDRWRALGLTPARFEPQGLFLTRLARPWLADLSNTPEPGRAAAVRQFHTLTHPAHLGAAFHALELAWNVPADPAAAATARRRLALAPDPAAPAGPDPLRDFPMPS